MAMTVMSVNVLILTENISTRNIFTASRPPDFTHCAVLGCPSIVMFNKSQAVNLQDPGGENCAGGDGISDVAMNDDI